MNKIVLVFSFFIAAIILNAQGNVKNKNTSPAPEDSISKADKQTNRLTEILSLDPEQKVRVNAINLDKNRQVDAARIKAGKDEDVFIIDHQRINYERNQSINAILTPEQQVKWIRIKEENKRKGSAQTADALD